MYSQKDIEQIKKHYSERELLYQLAILAVLAIGIII